MDFLATVALIVLIVFLIGTLCASAFNAGVHVGERNKS